MLAHSVFIGYRVDDASAEAREIYSKLDQKFPKAIFLDDAPGGIANGEDFEKRIAREIDRCSVVLVVIGPEWASIQNENGVKRIDDPDDYVRFEVLRALASKKLVVPIYVRGARWLKKTDLPEDLEGLRKLSGRVLPPRQEGFDDGLIHLAERIKEVLEPPTGRLMIAWANFGLVTAAAFLFGWWAGSATEIGREMSSPLTAPLATLLAGIWKWSGGLFKRDDWQQRIQSIFSSARVIPVTVILLSSVLVTMLKSQVVEITSPERVRYQITVPGKTPVSNELSGNGKSGFFLWWPWGRRLSVRDEKGRSLCAEPVKDFLWERSSYNFVPVKGGLEVILYPGPGIFNRCSQIPGTVTIHVTRKPTAPNEAAAEIVPITQRAYHCEWIGISSSEDPKWPSGFVPGGFQGFVNDILPWERQGLAIGAAFKPDACGRQPELIVSYTVEVQGFPRMIGSAALSDGARPVEMHP